MAKQYVFHFEEAYGKGKELLGGKGAPRDQLLCLPLPLMPAKGFSWKRTTKPCLRAIRVMAFMIIWL